MGGCQSNTAATQQKRQAMEAKVVDRILDREQSNAAQADAKVNKLLLLGAGESGKSTLFKQMITIHGKGFNIDDRKNYIPVIQINLISCMHILCKAAPKHGGPVACTESVEYVKKLAESLPCSVTIDKTNVQHFKKLWADSGIRKAFENRSRFQLPDSADYFFDQLDTIAAEGWIPSQQDVLHVRVRTTGIEENHFEIEGNSFRMFDVGGQRSERKKWIHCFENVTAVLFVAAMNEYDMMLYEDESVNRMIETVNLFEDICSSPWFTKTAIILFLNKRDLFATKVQKVPLKVCPLFTNYTGANTYEAGCALIEKTFLERNKNPANDIYIHITCATDTNNIRVVFDAVKDIVIRRALVQVGLL